MIFSVAIGHSQNNGRVRADASEETRVAQSSGRRDDRSRTSTTPQSLESSSYRSDSPTHPQRRSSGTRRKTLLQKKKERKIINKIFYFSFYLDTKHFLSTYRVTEEVTVTW